MTDNNFNEANFPYLFSLNNDVKKLIKIIKNVSLSKKDLNEQIHTKYKNSFYDEKKPKPKVCFWENRNQNDSTEPVPISKIQIFNEKTGFDASGAKIVYGSNTDNFLLQNNLLALVIGSKILMKKQLMQSQSQESEEVLMHELTHVAQNNKKDEYRNKTKQEMEIEATLSEQIANQQEIDPFIERIIEGKKYKLKKSQWKIIDLRVERGISDYIENQKYCLSEKEYLNLLIRYDDYLESKSYF